MSSVGSVEDETIEIEHAEPLQFPRAVGREGDRRADFRQFVRLLEDFEGYSALT